MEKTQPSIDAQLSLWAIRDEGVRLRNETPRTMNDFCAWKTRYVDDWYPRMKTAAEACDPRLAHHVGTLNEIEKESPVPVTCEEAGSDQVLLQRCLSEELRRLEKYLEQGLNF